MFTYINMKTLEFAIVLTLIDYIWIQNVMKDKYIKWFRSLSLKFEIKYISIFVTYMIMISVYPLFIEKSKDKIKTAIIIGGLIFSLYGFTLASFFPKYDLSFALQESLWGMCLYGLSTYIVEATFQ